MVAFRKPTPNYAVTEPVETPYTKAAKAWDSRIGDARVQARNWRMVAFGNVALALALSGGLIWQGQQRQVLPIVVQIDAQGDVLRSGAAGVYNPTDAQLKHYLALWVNKVRSKPTDPVVLRQNWLSAYDYLGQQAAQALSAYAQENDPFKDVGKTAKTVEIASIVKQSERSYQVRWRETLYVGNAVHRTDSYTGLFTTSIKPPTTEEQVYKNPLGIIIETLNWSREF